MERRKNTRTRSIVEAIGVIVAASAVYVAVSQYEYARHKDAQDAALAISDKEHSAIISAVMAETEARKDGDGRLTAAVGELVKAQAQQTTAVTTLITEMRFILKRLNLDGVESP